MNISIYRVTLKNTHRRFWSLLGKKLVNLHENCQINSWHFICLFRHFVEARKLCANLYVYVWDHTAEKIRGRITKFKCHIGGKRFFCGARKSSANDSNNDLPYSGQINQTNTRFEHQKSNVCNFLAVLSDEKVVLYPTGGNKIKASPAGWNEFRKDWTQHYRTDWDRQLWRNTYGSTLRPSHWDNPCYHHRTKFLEYIGYRRTVACRVHRTHRAHSHISDNIHPVCGQQQICVGGGCPVNINEKGAF